MLYISCLFTMYMEHALKHAAIYIIQCSVQNNHLKKRDKILSKYTSNLIKLHHYLIKYLGEHTPELSTMGADDIFFQYEITHFLFSLHSKYTVKHVNCNYL